MKNNPFRFGDPVGGDFYFPLPKFSQQVNQYLDNKIHLVILGPRRLGKTSFILNTLREKEKQGKACILIDTFNITSHRDFLQQVVRALKIKQTWLKKLKNWSKFLTQLKPKFGWKMDAQTQEVSFSFSPEVVADQDWKDLIQDTLVALGELGEHVIIAIDEFQKISEIDDDGWLEATIRTQMQQSKTAVYLFSGSRRSVIHDMLNNPHRPFYRTCQVLEFPIFDDDFTQWIIHRFKTVGITCEKEAVTQLRREVQDTPNYVQMACFHLVAQGVEHVGLEEMRQALQMIARQNGYAHQTLLNSLTPIQQRALRLAANEGENIYNKEALWRYEISGAPHLASAIKALKDKQILESEGAQRGRVIFDDPLFSLWLKLEFGK